MRFAWFKKTILLLGVLIPTSEALRQRPTASVLSTSTPTPANSIANDALSDEFPQQHNGVVSQKIPRGGACSDTDATVLMKVGLSAAVETAALLGVFYVGQELADSLGGNVFGLPISYWLSILAVVFASSFFGGLVEGGMSAATKQALDPNVIPGDPDWYTRLKKPSWNPPGWVFPIMWLIVSKPTQAVALSKLFKATESTGIPWKELAVYCGHLSLGDAWNKVFFGFQCTGKGAAVISAFFTVLLTSAYLFSEVDAVAGKFLLPTCGWVAIATALNWNIYLNNNLEDTEDDDKGGFPNPIEGMRSVLQGLNSVFEGVAGFLSSFGN